MANKLERFREQIEILKANGDSVRSIAAKLSSMSGERVAPSSVHQFLKVQQLPTNQNGNGGFNAKSETNVEGDSPVLDGHVDSLEVRLDGIDQALNEIALHQERTLSKLAKQQSRLGVWIGYAGFVVWCDFVWTIRFDLSAMWKVSFALATGLVLGWLMRGRYRGGKP